MISIEKLMNNIKQCRDTNISLPIENDNINNKFIQNTALQMRLSELNMCSSDNAISMLTPANYTMDEDIQNVKELTVTIKEDFKTASGNYNNTNTNNNTNNNKFCIPVDIIIPSKSLIVYTENETAQIPEILLSIFTAARINIDKWYIYGVKNPESFYKSFRFLHAMDFIIKNKSDKKNDIITLKREMALHYETFYKTLNYRKLKFSNVEMINNLTNVDNYVEYDAIKYMVDYNMCNLILLDIINEQYLDVTYTPHTILNNTNVIFNKNIEKTQNNNIPKLDETHSTLEYIIIIKYANNTYLPIMNSDGLHKFNNTMLDVIRKHFERVIVNKFKETEHNYDLENPATLTSDNISSFYNNNLDALQEQVKTGDCSINNLCKLNMTISETINQDDIISSSNHIASTSIEPCAVACASISKFDELMNRIPIKQQPGIKTKAPKTPKTSIIPIPKAILASTLAPAPAPAPETENDIKPINKYNLLELQMLAKLYKIDTQKMGSSNKKINKTKTEMYDEILIKDKQLK